MLELGLLLVTIASALLSLSLGVRFIFTVRDVGTLRPSDAVAGSNEALGTSPPLRRVSVVMPARNEARDIESAIRSILQQRHVAVQLVVINDHSTDDTGEIVDRLSRETERITVIHHPELVAGWFGKANAMQHGWNCTDADFVLFTDADIVHHPECFSRALETLETDAIDFLSLLPEFQCVSLWENALLPHSFIAGSVHFLSKGINRPSSKRAAAAGAFILTRRSVLEHIGGLYPVRQEMLDDISLAQVVKRNGFLTRIHFAPRLLTVRLFKSNKDAFWGPTKNILSSVNRLWKAIPLMFLPLFIYWIPLATFAVGWWQSRWEMVIAGAATYGLQASLLCPFTPICQMRWRWALFFPLAAIPVFCCFSVALYHRLFARSVAWRGRVIPISDA